MRCFVLLLGVLVIASVASAGTFDPDGAGDVIFTWNAVVNGDSAHAITWMESDGTDNGLSYVRNIRYDVGAEGSSHLGLGLGDFDADGASDAFIGRPAAGYSNWYENDGTDNGIKWTNSFYGAKAGGVAIGDFLNDGEMDFFRVRTDYRLDWYYNSAPDTMKWKGIASGLHAIAMGDLDSDGRLGVFYSSETVVYWAEDVSASNATKLGYHTRIEVAGVEHIEVGDFDGDSTMDMFVVQNDGTVQWLEAGVGNDVMPSVVNAAVASGANCTAVGDYDGDGVAELLIGSDAGINIYEATANNGMTLVDTLSAYQGITDIDIMVIPEPMTLSLLALGGLGLLRRRRS